LEIWVTGITIIEKRKITIDKWRKNVGVICGRNVHLSFFSQSFWKAIILAEKIRTETENVSSRIQLIQKRILYTWSLLQYLPLKTATRKGMSRRGQKAPSIEQSCHKKME